MKKRQEFSSKVKLAAWRRSGGYCECGCHVKIIPGDGPEYDHRLEDFFDGPPTLENCVVLRTTCHKAKGKERAPVIAKARRLEKKRAGIGKPRSRLSHPTLKRKLDGTVVPRDGGR